MKVFFQIMKSPRGVLPIMAFTGRLRPNGELFQASGIIDDRGGISLAEVYESVVKTVISVCIQKAQKCSEMNFMAVKTERSEIRQIS